MKKLLSIITFIAVTTFVLESKAAKNITFEQHITNLKQELKAKNYDPKIIDEAFNNNFKLDKKVKKAVKNQPEVKNTFDKYLNSKLAPFRVNQGKKLYVKHYDLLKRLEKKYKVNPEIIIALWGLESNYGTYPIKYSPVKSLATMSYTHKRKSRREFFKRELFALFELGKKHNVDILKTTSSWAGALGQCQFMPSNVLNYAADGDSDGKVDIWTNDKDVLASIANFLKSLRWKHSEYNYITLNKSKTTEKLKYNRKFKTIDEWQKLGVKLASNNIDSKFRLYSPKNKENKVFLVSKNFDIIKRWNNSDYFAFSALSLAEEISKAKTLNKTKK